MDQASGLLESATGQPESASGLLESGAGQTESTNRPSESANGPSEDPSDGHRTQPRLTRLTLEGYKSFRGESIDFGDVTVLLGANGAGKSNLVSFFQMLGFLGNGALQEFVGRSGGSDSLLFGGRRMSKQIRAEVVFEERDHATGRGTTTTYTMRLGDAAPDTLIFLEERARSHRTDSPTPRDIPLGAGHAESQLPGRQEDATCRVVLRLLRECRSYHFHDTSSTANIRRHHYIEDARYLRSDAGNLAAYLHRLEQTRPDSYRRIVDTVQLVLPTFADFSLAPSTTNDREIILKWRERGRPDHLLGPHQLSDGSLRFIALATLFLQPPEELPNVIVLDGPELGLNPYAIHVLGAMVRAAATEVQVVLATQSSRLVDEFEPGDVLVLEAGVGSGTKCHRPRPDILAEWLREYSLGELWEKNHLGGRP